MFHFKSHVKLHIALEVGRSARQRMFDISVTLQIWKRCGNPFGMGLWLTPKNMSSPMCYYVEYVFLRQRVWVHFEVPPKMGASGRG